VKNPNLHMFQSVGYFLSNAKLKTYPLFRLIYGIFSLYFSFGRRKYSLGHILSDRVSRNKMRLSSSSLA
jgi:pSer/pThr/pTyr-binding forkhead associated (FHA) protein